MAWQRLIDLVSTPGAIAEASSDDVLSLLDPFMTNPERHREHVKCIVQAAGIAYLGEMLADITARPLWRFGRRSEPESLLESKEAFVAKLERLGNELSATVQPAAVEVDLLPSRGVPTPTDWLNAGLHLEMIQVKVALRPCAGREPTSLSVSLSFSDPDIRFVDHFPASEFAALGTREVQITDEGRFVASGSDTTKGSTGLGVHGLHVSSDTSRTDSHEVAGGHTASDKLIYTPKVRKVISSAVGNNAHWELLASSPDAPVGGMDFFASILVAGPSRTVPVLVEIGARFEGWGELRISQASDLRVAATALTTT